MDSQTPYAPHIQTITGIYIIINTVPSFLTAIMYTRIAS
jgi:hypothetical protein